MVDVKGNDFFEEDDDFFAEAFRSISELETSTLKIIEENNSDKQKCGISNDKLLSSNQINPQENSPEISNSCNDNDFYLMKNFKKSNNCHNERIHIENSSFVEDKNCSYNQRFNAGYIPKSAKRKFPGPAGILIDEPPRKLSFGNFEVSKSLEPVDLEIELIKSSQFSIEELLETVSWKKLQEEVSSNQTFFTNAKHFSVQRVLSDTLKKKLPKHIVVPLLCLYIKKFNHEEPVSTYMDDTGEISGKVDKEVLDLYSDYIKTGTSLVLRNITFMCNIMLLKKTNIVSVYLDDGNVHHLQRWDTLTEELSQSFSCVFPVTPKVMGKSRLENMKVTPVSKQLPNRKMESVQSRTSGAFLQVTTPNHSNFKHSQTSSNPSLNTNNHQIKGADATNFSHTDLEMDDFDELLVNLDESSFLDEIPL